MNEIEKKIADWAWELYSKYMIATNYGINCFYSTQFEICLKHAKNAYEQAEESSENE